MTTSGADNSQRLVKTDLTSLFADKFRKLILDGELKPGTKLPPQRELCQTYEVSRVVVREAISRLQHEGLVASRQGAGVYVSASESVRFLSISENSYEQPLGFTHLYQLRNVLESGTAELAAIHRDEKDLETLDALIAAMTSESRTPESYIDADIGFHRAVANASKNPFLLTFISFVDMKLKESISTALNLQNFVETTLIAASEHAKIAQCIREKDSVAARKSMEEHLTNSSQRLGLLEV